MAKVTMLNGSAVLVFDWSRATYEPLAGMARAHTALLKAAERSQAKLDELARNKDFTSEGRRNQIRAFFATDALPVLREAYAASEAAQSAVAEITGEMREATIDKTDVAGALLRQEIRAHYRTMEPADRAARLSGAKPLDPEVAIALMEAPTDLTGLTEDQRARLKAHALASINPEASERIAELDKATEALASTERAVSHILMDVTGYTSLDLDVMTGKARGASVAAVPGPAAA